MSVHDLSVHPLHLGLGACSSVEPAFGGGMAWYEAYEARHAADGAEGRLVALHRFDASWAMWEMHPHGSEVVLCTDGTMTLLQEGPDGRVERLTLTPGQYAVNPPGVWHTADVPGTATALFITAGLGTCHRPR
jgi:mannose-6-phosphate isomerase-like protein (cupin superfamily)